MICLAKLSDFLIRNHKIFSDRSAHRKQRLSPVNFILALRYLRLDYYKRLSIACIGKTGSGLYRILKQRASAWNACINKNMNICIHHYPILLFYAVFSLSLFDFIVILRRLRFRSIYHNSFLTSLYVSYFRVCSLAHWNVASVPPSYNLFFSLITLIWLLSSIYEKISVAYLIQFSLFVPALFNHSRFRWEFYDDRSPLSDNNTWISVRLRCDLIFAFCSLIALRARCRKIPLSSLYARTDSYF